MKLFLHLISQKLFILSSIILLSACGGGEGEIELAGESTDTQQAQSSQQDSLPTTPEETLNHPQLLPAAMIVDQGDSISYLMKNDGGSVHRCSISPALPQGIVIQSSNDSCYISGIATIAQPATPYEITAGNAGGIHKTALVLEIRPVISEPEIPQLTNALLTGKTGQTLRLILASSAGDINQCSISPALPDGLSLIRYSNRACMVTGVSNQIVSNQLFRVTAANDEGTDDAFLRVNITSSISAPDLKDTSATPKTGQAISVRIPNQGGAVNSCQVQPALPAGLTLTPSGGSCLITGTMDMPLTSQAFTISAENIAGNSSSILTLNVTQFVPAPQLNDAILDAEYDQNLEVLMSNTGGAATCSITPSLPAGLALIENDNGCFISGRLNTAHTGNYQVTASNDSGSDTAILSLRILKPLQAPLLIDIGDQSFITDNNIRLVVVNAGGDADLCEISPTLPQGLTLTTHQDQCEITGQVPSPLDQAFQLTASNRKGNSAVSFTVSIEEPLALPAIGDLPDAEFLTTDTIEIAFINSGGELDECRANHDLPDGLSLVLNQNPDRCVLTGTVSTATDLNLVITAVNESGSDEGNIRLIVREPLQAPQITKLIDHTFETNTDISILFRNSGGDIENCHIEPELATGLQLETLTTGCRIHGQLTVPLNRRLTMTAMNAAGSSQAHVLLQVNEPLSRPQLNGETSYQFTQEDTIEITLLNSGGDIIECSIEPELPASLTLNQQAEACTISGAAEDVLDETFRITARNNSGEHAHGFTLQIEEKIQRNVEYLNIAVNADTYVNGGNKAGQNYGTSSQLRVQTAGDSYTRQSLFRFDSSAFARLESEQAYLRIFIDEINEPPGTAEFSINASDQLWQETSLTHNSMQSLLFSALDNSHVLNRTAHAGQWVWLDINSAISQSLNEEQLTLRLKITDDSKPSRLFIASKEAQGNKAARLVINPHKQAPLLTAEDTNFSADAGVEIEWLLLSNAGSIDRCVIDQPLPQGLSLDRVSFGCLIHGIATTALDLTGYQISAENSAGTHKLNIQLAITSPLAPPAISDRSISVLEGESIQVIFPNQGANNAIESCRQEDNLPNGLALTHSAENCIISGSVDHDQTENNYRITALNSAGSSTAIFTLTVRDPAPVLVAAEYNDHFANPVFVELGNNGGLPDTCHANDLPQGLAVSVEENTCVIRGAVSEVFSGNIEVSARNESGESKASVSFNIVAPLFAPSIQDQSANVLEDEAIQVVFSNSADHSRIDHCNSSPTLPSGLTLDVINDECVVSGMVTYDQPETTYEITASNTAGSGTAYFKLTVRDPAPILQDASYDEDFDQSVIINIVNSGGLIDECSITPALPDGLALIKRNSNCVIEGSYPSEHDASYQVTGVNESGSDTAQVQITLNQPILLPKLADANSIVAENEAFSAILLNTGGIITSCDLADDSPTLPTGVHLALENNHCQISGSVSTAQSNTSYFIVASNIQGNSRAQFNLTVNGPMPNLENLVYSEIYTKDVSIRVNNTGGIIDRCEITPQLPDGLRLSKRNGDCTIGGRYEQVHNQTYNVRAINSSGISNAQLEINLTEAFSGPPQLSNKRISVVPPAQITVKIENTGGALEGCGDIFGSIAEANMSLTHEDDGCIVSGIFSKREPVSWFVTSQNRLGQYGAFLFIDIG